MLSKRLMYGFLIQLFFCTVLLANTGNAQRKTLEEVKISVNLTDKSLSQFFRLVESKTDFKFTYTDNLVDLKQPITIVENNESLYDVLVAVSIQTHLDFVQVNQNIHVKKSNNSKNLVEVVEPMEVTVSGKVTDENGEPLPGASVTLAGTTSGTVTDIDGNYTITVPEGATLIFSYIGFEKMQVPVDNQTLINVSLQPDLSSLEEVEVLGVGYGSLKKQNLTGSVGSVNMDETLESRPMNDFGQALYGQISGVNVTSASGGRPGSVSTVKVRGTNSISAGGAALVVIDGVQLPNFDLNSINPLDIASIEVLKDAASAAIYGSRGANGVILVTTKSGKSGDPRLEVNYTFSMQEVIRKYDVMNGPEYAAAAIDAAQNGWIDSGGDPNAPNTLEARGQIRFTWPEALERPETLSNTDFQDVIFRIAPMHRLNLRFSGGDKKTQFMFSANYLNQKGIIIQSDFQRYNLSMKVNSNLNDWIEIGSMINAGYDNAIEPHGRIAEWAVQYPSIYPVYGNNGYLGSPDAVDGFEQYYGILFRAKNGHPLNKYNDRYTRNNFNALGNIFTKVKLYDGLYFRTGLNVYYRRQDNTSYNARDNNMGPAFYDPGMFTSNMDRTFNYIWENLITYDKTIGGHSFNIIGGYEYNHRDLYSMTARQRDYDNDNFPYLSAGKTILGGFDAANQTTLISYIGRLSYDYKEKYLITASLRRDGSSRFGPNNKWGYFPSISGAWRIIEEPFIKSLTAISNLKFRASYGFTGNDRFNDYRWISQMTPARVAIGNNVVDTFYPSSIENANLAWERTRQFNLGLDFGLFKQRIIMEADIYRSVSDNLLLDVPIPSTSGFTSVFANMGEVMNKGIELSITSQNIVNKKLSWNTQVIFHTNRNEILRLGPSGASMIYAPPAFSDIRKINQIGEPAFSFLGFQYDGVYMNQSEIEADPSSYPGAKPGYGRYKDINGDGVLDSNDRTIIGNTQPDFTWAVTNNFSLGNFNFSFMFHGVVGGEIYDDNAVRSLIYHEGRNYLGGLRNRWRSEENPGDGYHPKLSVVTETYEKTASSYWLTSGSFLRLKDVTIGYNLPQSIYSKIGISTARIFINGVNLFTIQKSTVYDPESSTRGAGYVPIDAISPIEAGIGGAGYPPAKIYSLGINVGF